MQEIYAAWQAGGAERLIDYVHQDFEGTVPPELSAEPDRYRGPDGVRRWFAGFEDTLDDVRIVPLEMIEAGDRVIVPVRLTARGAGSGIEVEQDVVQVWRFRDGKVVRLDAFPDLESAREAAGSP
jgi:ketosteroid isomerase-like protein